MANTCWFVLKRYPLNFVWSPELRVSSQVRDWEDSNFWTHVILNILCRQWITWSLFHGHFEPWVLHKGIASSPSSLSAFVLRVELMSVGESSLEFSNSRLTAPRVWWGSSVVGLTGCCLEGFECFLLSLSTTEINNRIFCRLEIVFVGKWYHFWLFFGVRQPENEVLSGWLLSQLEVYKIGASFRPKRVGHQLGTIVLHCDSLWFLVS